MASSIQDLSSLAARSLPSDEDANANQTGSSPAAVAAAAAQEIRRIARALRDPVTGPQRCEALAAELLRVCERLPTDGAASTESISTDVRRAYASLSPRELQIFKALAEGLSVADIASRLNRSPKTVNNHRTHVMKKLGLRNTAELTRLAFRLGVASL